jgi:type IV pilus assembly protein PilQ
MKKYFFIVILFLIAVNYSYAFQKATNVESIAFENNKCIIKGNGYMFYRTFTLDRDDSKIVAIDILGIKSYNPDIPSLILAKDSDAVNLITLALHKDKNIGLRVAFKTKKNAQYQIDRNNNTITVVFNEDSAQQANKENPKPQPLSQETTQTSLNTPKDNNISASNESVSAKNTIESISAGALKDKTQISIITDQKPIYEVKNENGNILVTVKDVGPSKPTISNTSKLVENITTSIEKNDYNIKILTNNAHIDAISSTDKSIFVILSPVQSVENLNIVSKEEKTGFVGKKISFDVRDADLQDVLRVIATAANLNVMFVTRLKVK